MADVIITLKVMAESPEVDMEKLEKEVLQKLIKYAYEKDVDMDTVMKEKEEQHVKVEVEPVAFGLKALKVTFAMDESRGGTEPFENELKQLESVRDCEVIGITRAMG